MVGLKEKKRVNVRGENVDDELAQESREERKKKEKSEEKKKRENRGRSWKTAFFLRRVPRDLVPANFFYERACVLNESKERKERVGNGDENT